MVTRRLWTGICLILLSCRTQISVPQTPTAVSTTTDSSFSVHLPISMIPAASPSPTATATPCLEPGQVQQQQLTTQLAGLFRYRVYYPPCYGLDGHVYPVLYLLPGNIHTDSIWDELGIDEAADTAVHQARIPPLLIIMLDGGWLANNTSGGAGSYETLFLSELLPHIEATTCAWADASGRAIGGLSRGGYWALEIAFRHVDTFASVGGHSAALLDMYAGPNINPRYTGLNQQVSDLRIYLDIGMDDYLSQPLQQLHEEMAQAHIPHEWVLNTGGHDEAYWRTHVLDYLLWYTQPWQLPRNTYPLCTK